MHDPPCDELWLAYSLVVLGLLRVWDVVVFGFIRLRGWLSSYLVSCSSCLLASGVVMCMRVVFDLPDLGIGFGVGVGDARVVCVSG